MDLLACMSLAGTIPVVLCFLLYLLQGGSYNYQLGRKLLLTGVVFFLIPFQLVKYLIPEDIFPKPMFSEESQLYLSHSLNFWHEKETERIRLDTAMAFHSYLSVGDDCDRLFGI